MFRTSGSARLREPGNSADECSLRLVLSWADFGSQQAFGAGPSRAETPRFHDALMGLVASDSCGPGLLAAWTGQITHPHTSMPDACRS